ncbi:MAG: hypothetical protein ACRCTI_12300 [Beijerinckiaceae bacterium]
MRLAAVLSVLMTCSAAAETCGPERLERATLARVAADGDIHLTDGRVLRLAGLHRPDGGLVPLRAGENVAFGGLAESDRWSRLPAVVFALPEGGEPVWLQEHMAARGQALVRFEPALGACWPLLLKAEARAAALPVALPEPGRYARIEGRVSRVGEGRSAHFVTIFDSAGQRLTGMVQKRHMARLKRGGVDVSSLTGQIVRLRGIRSLRNSKVILLTRAEQIEIVR